MVRAKVLLAGIIVVFVLFPVANYIALHSNVMDLGVFEHQIAVLAGGVWQAALSGHLQGYSLALASLLPATMGAGFPVGIGLVGTQALLLILPAFFFLRIAGIWVALAYVAYGPVWINAHFDFHYDHLAIPLLLGFYLCLRNGRSWRAFLFAGLLAFVKEPFALQTAACGLLMVLMAAQSRGAACAASSPHGQGCPSNNAALKGRFWLPGIALIMMGCGYFYFAVGYAMPYFAPVDWKSPIIGGEAFSWLGHGLREIVGNIISHPLAILREILTTPGKLIYLFVVFGLLAFIPLLAPGYLIPALPLLAIAMISRFPNYYDYNTHYTAGLIIPVMFAFVHGLPKAHALWMRGAGWAWRKVVFPRPDTCLHAEKRPHPNPPPQALKDSDPLRAEKPARAESYAGEGTYALRVRSNAVGLEQSVRPEPVEGQLWFDKLTTNRFWQFMLRQDSPERSQRAQALRQAQGKRRKSTVLTTGDARLSNAFYVLLALWILAGHVILSPSPISRLFWSDKVWSYSWQAYVPTEREAMMKEAMLKYIPTDPSVSVTTQNTVNWYHLAHRKVYAPFPMGVIEPMAVMDWSNRSWEGLWGFVQTGHMTPAITHGRYADYVVLDLKRPWFIIDKGCDWLYGACRNDEMAEKFLRLVDETRQRYDTIFERDGFMILRRIERDHHL